MSARLLKDPNTASCRIFVGHLQTDEMTKMDLEEHFSKYGPVIGALMNRGFGFVQFENEESAHAAIRNEDGQMYKGRRIDVKPAKKDGNTLGNNQFSNRNPQQHNNYSSSSGSQMFGGNKNQNFNSTNQSFNTSSTAPNSSFEEPPKSAENPQSQCDFTEDNDEEDAEGDQKFTENTQNNNSFNSNQEKEEEESFNQQNENRFEDTAGGGSTSGGNSNGSNPNSGSNNQGKGNNNNNNNQNQNRPGNNQNNQNNKNQNNQGNNQTRTRGSRGGKNRNKNRDNLGGNNFRDRSPLNRGNRGGNDDMAREWEMNKMRGGNAFGPRDNYNEPLGRFDDRFKDMMPGPNFRPMGPPDYPPVVDKNDCEIIVVHKNLTEYAEAIEARLKKIGLTVDLLFPNEEVSLSRVLGNIANRGCLYAVVVMPINLEHHSLTLNILHGLPQEHRNMPVEDALNLISRDFSNFKSGGRGVPLNTPFTSDRHPDAIQVLLNMLADNHQLTVLQHDRVIKYLEIKREEQVQIELGDAKDLPATTLGMSDPKQAELQSRILNILNSNRANANAPIPSPVPAPAPVPPATWAADTSTTSTAATGVTPSPLLNDPTVQKALDSLLQGNLLKSIGDPQSTTGSSSQPLFAAFPNINRL